MSETQTEQVLTFTPEALQTLNRMQQRINEIGYWHGEDEAGRAAKSFAHCIGGLLNMGGRVMWDGDLSLVANTNVGMVVGMNWSRESITRTVERRYPNKEDQDAQLDLIENIKGFVESGTWSLNS